MVASCEKRDKVVACGMSCRLPESDNVEEFWDQLIQKVNLVTDDKRRWDPEFFGLPKGSGKLKDISKFDASFFGILPKQADKMDPQIRVLMEVSYEAIVDAGFNPQELRGSKTGVYIASSYSEANILLCGDMSSKDGYGVTGSFRTFLANKLSYFFDFKGPSYALDAACCSGLVVLHNAIQDILNGQCDNAIVGGVTMTLRPQTTHSLHMLQILAPDGKCKTFDKSGNGFARSEAVVALFISRETLSRRAYGHLVHSVTNHGGFSQQGITFPSFEAQADLFRRAYSEPGISISDVEFIETHGTGTDAGDPVETNAIYEVFCQKRTPDNPLLIGSVKSNMGHAECSAGLASLVKVLMTINNEMIPPNLHFNIPNPKIKGLQDGTLKVVTEPTKFKGGLIGVNSFGFGGTNAHIVVKPYTVSLRNGPCSIPRVVISSGRTKEGVLESLKYMSAKAKDAAFHQLTTQVANTAVFGMPYRGYKVLSNLNNTAEVRKVDNAIGRPIWYIFTGMGGDWPGMGKDLMVVPSFQKMIVKCHDVIAATDPEINLLDLIMNGTKEKLDTTMAKFVTNVSIQIALVNCLKDLGIHPDGIIGHSMGETACAYADGLLTEERTVLAAYWRGRCVLDANPPLGRMASVGLGWEEVKSRLPPEVVAACHNAENNVTISGNAEVVDCFLSEIAAEGVFARQVNTNRVAYHSPHMVPIVPTLQEALKKIVPHKVLRSKTWLSTSYPEDLWDTEQAKWLDSSYLVNNLVSPVLFHEAVSKIPSDAIVIEIAPHGLMEVLLKRSLHQDCDYISLMHRKEPDNLHYFLSIIGKLFSLGVCLDLSSLYSKIEYPFGAGTPPLSPGIHWDHSTKWAVPSWEDFINGGGSDRSVATYEIDITEAGSDSFLKDHNIDGRVLYPATGYIVLAWRAMAYMMTTVPENLAIDFSEINIHRATILPETGKVKLTVRIFAAMKSFEISENNEVTASGKYNLPEAPFVPEDLYPLEDNEGVKLEQHDIYKEFRLLGYHYGPNFQKIKRSRLDGQKAVVEWDGNWVTFLDSVMQVSILGKSNPSKCLYLPTRILSLRINPLVQTRLCNKEVPVVVDKVMGMCHAGGVKIVGLHTTMAPKRPLKQHPTLEYVRFVPYGETHIAVPKMVSDYGTMCKKYLSFVLSNIPLMNHNESLNSLKAPANLKDNFYNVETYQNDESCAFFNVLHQIGELKGRKDFLRDVLNIIDINAAKLSRDRLLSFLLRDEKFRHLLDVVWENSATKTVKVAELGARFGGLFIHIVPVMTSQPLLQLNYIATDRHVDRLSTAFKDQLQTLNVKTSNYDVNKDDVDGLNNVNFVVVRGLAQQSKSVLSTLGKIHSLLAEGGFLLLYEVTSNFEVYCGLDEIIHQLPREDACERKLGIYLSRLQWEEKLKSAGFEVIQQLRDGFSSTVFLCRKLRHACNDVFIHALGKDFSWINDIKEELNKVQTNKDHSGDNIWLIVNKDSHSGIVGMVNCLRQEYGGNKIRCIFNADGDSKLQEVHLDASLMAKLVRKDLVMNIFKDGMWGSYRHVSLKKDEFTTNTERAYVNVLNRGDLSSLCWIQSPKPIIHSSTHHVLCTVYYSSLNFRDVMLASGKLPADAIPEHLAHRESLIGIEFVGRDQEGKRVMGIVSSEGLATSVAAEPHLLFDVPDSWSLEDAATVPIVYSSAYYALVVRGRLKYGESVLIHSGSGGVGQAAIAIALSYGCQVYTTVGTEKKRHFLMKQFPTLNESCFANSRDSSFEEHVMKETGGAGVNVVLNSLSGEKLEASLRCLSIDGRFLEIGKYDLSQNKQIGASIFLKNTSFQGIHFDRILQKGNTEWLQVVDLMKTGLCKGVVQPISRDVFRHDEVEKAFRFMAQGKHIGKVVIKIRSEEATSISSSQSISVLPRNSPDPLKVYIVVGGLGGFGLELADWLVTRGCRKLVFTSRSGVTTGYQARCVSRWESLGVAVQISVADASKVKECDQLLRESKKMGLIGGIFNLALVLKDGFLDSLTPEDFKAVCSPKIDVARNLDQETRKMCGPELEWFVMFSSVVCGRGNAGQSNYGFANSAMERLCEERTKDNLPGLAIQWGVVGDVGIVAESIGGDETEIAGCVAQRMHSCLSTLDLFLSQPYPVLSSFIKADRDRITFEEAPKINMEMFVAKYFGIEDVNSISQDITLSELGLDSLMGVEVKQTLERDFSTVLSIKQIRSLTLKNILNDFGSELASNNLTDTSSVMPHRLFVSPLLSWKDTDCMVQLNVGKTQNAPVFLIHPIEGTIDVFRPLVSKLQNYSLYALKFTKEVPHDSMFNMATNYLSKMRSVQPDGPYNITGYSFGALVALEIAVVLQNEQFNATSQNNLMLIDAAPDFVSSRIRRVLEDQIEETDIQAVGQRDAMDIHILTYFVQLFKQCPFNEEADLKGLVSINVAVVSPVKYHSSKIQLRNDLLGKATYRERLDLAVSIVLEVVPDIDKEDLAFSIDTFVKRTCLAKNYQPKTKYKGSITLLKAKESSKEFFNKTTDYNLSKICSGKVEVQEIEGDHETIMQEPGLENVAQKMKELFNYKT